MTQSKGESLNSAELQNQNHSIVSEHLETILEFDIEY